MTIANQSTWVVIKHIFEDYYAGGIEVCGAFQSRNAAVDCLLAEADKTLEFINNNADKYPIHIRLFGSEDYWTACVKEKGITKNIAEIFIREVPAKTDTTQKED